MVSFYVFLLVAALIAVDVAALSTLNGKRKVIVTGVSIWS